MKHKNAYLSMLAGLGMSLGAYETALAHTAYADLTGKVAGVTVSGAYSYGWANGTRVNGVGTATTNLGDTHFINKGGTVVVNGKTSTLVTLFSFTASSATHTITATDQSVSATDYADPAISLYRGWNASGAAPYTAVVPGNAHDDTAVDPKVPIAIANPTETGTTWPFDGLRTLGAATYDGQFSAFGDFSLANDAGARTGLVWLASKSARAYSDAVPAHARGGNGAWGKTETLTYTGFVPGSVYTIIVGGERCIAKTKQPYAAVTGGTCNSGAAWNPNTTYSINVKAQ